MEEHGDAATGITSVLLTKSVQTLHCQRRGALHHCEDPTSEDSFSHRVQIGTGKFACTAQFPSPAKVLANVQLIKVAIMRHGSTWISSIGAALNHIMSSMTDEISSENVLRHVDMGTRTDASAKSERPFALFMKVQPFARVMFEILYILTK